MSDRQDGANGKTVAPRHWDSESALTVTPAEALIQAMESPPEWIMEAECGNTGIDMFDKSHKQEAIAVCKTCPFYQNECAGYASRRTVHTTVYQIINGDVAKSAKSSKTG